MCLVHPLLFSSVSSNILRVKSNGTIVATIYVVIRVVTYIVRSPPASYPSKNWFTEEDKYLYIFVSIIVVLEAPVGLWLSKHINQTTLQDDFSVYPNH